MPNTETLSHKTVNLLNIKKYIKNLQHVDQHNPGQTCPYGKLLPPNRQHQNANLSVAFLIRIQ